MKQVLIAIYTGSMAMAPEGSWFAIASKDASISVQALWRLKWETKS